MLALPTHKLVPLSWSAAKEGYAKTREKRTPKTKKAEPKAFFTTCTLKKPWRLRYIALPAEQSVPHEEQTSEKEKHP
jgi:hypothetical protein